MLEVRFASAGDAAVVLGFIPALAELVLPDARQRGVSETLLYRVAAIANEALVQLAGG